MSADGHGAAHKGKHTSTHANTHSRAPQIRGGLTLDALMGMELPQRKAALFNGKKLETRCAWCRDTCLCVFGLQLTAGKQ